MSLSVVLPNYNHAAWIACALQALAEQAEYPTEIIVVDDGSTDDSVAIIENLQKRYDSIRLIRYAENRGASAAVKTGLEVAKGEFLLFAAADDCVLPGLIGRGTAALLANPGAAFFCSEVAILDRDGNVAGFRPFTVPCRTSGYLSPDQVRRLIRSSDNWFVGSSIIYRRDRLAAIGYFDESLGSLPDAMATRLLAFRHGFYFAAQVLAAWRVYPESLSARSSLSSSENRRMLEAAARWIARKFPNDVRDEYGRLFDRRLRFNMARLQLVWNLGKIDWESLADLLNWHGFDRVLLRFVSPIPFISSKLVLIWMTIRMRPYGMTAILAGWWRDITVNRVRRASLQRLMSEANRDPGAYKQENDG